MRPLLLPLLLLVGPWGVEWGVESAHGDTVALGAAKDNTLYETSDGAFSSGKGPTMFTGRNANGEIRRAVIAFDIAGHIPLGATINAVELRLFMSRTPTVFAMTTSLHRLLSDWGEGTSDAGESGGGGDVATAGDATWIHTFFDASFWTQAGGDFQGAPSASAAVGPIGTYTWGTDPAMVADVQAWLDQPGTNFGWLIRGNEFLARTAKRFETRESLTSANRPQLTVHFTPATTPLHSMTWGRIKATYR